MDSAGNPDLPPREPPETFATPGDKPAHRPPPPPAAAAPRNPYPNWRLTLMNSVTLGFLAINAAFSVYRARSDPWILAFVVSAYAALFAFFCCVRAYEVAPPARKGPIKVVVFALAVLLILMFAYKVSSTMPFGFAVLTWLIAGVTTTFSFYGAFIMEGDDVKTGSGKSEGRKMAGNNQQL